MKDRRKPKVGETLWIYDYGNRARTDAKGRDGVVTKSGRKYFTVEFDGWKEQFELFNWLQKSNYSADFKAYENEQAVTDEIEASMILDKIADELRYIRSDNYPIDNLRKVAELLEIEVKKK